MKTFSINTLGCKVNQYESQQVRELLERFGLAQAESPDKPDLVVVNTCCVTHTASAKSRHYIRKAQKLSPAAVIVVCGCLPTVQTGELTEPAENVHIVNCRDELGVILSHIVNTTSALSQSNSLQDCRKTAIRAENEHKIKDKSKLTYPEFTELTSFKGHTRAFLKIQDGCDGYCSYCIIPQTRPFIHSKPIETVLREATALVEAGHKEIVLTGVFLGAFGQTTVRRQNWPTGQNDCLAELLDKIAQIPNLVRIRLSSLEPGDVTAGLLDVFRSRTNIMPHLHLSLQSGSNAVLKRMCRQYRADEFKEKIELIRSRLDRPAITTDFIVGFPGETDDDFQQTVDLANEVGFAKMHVFNFSPRKGTSAAQMHSTVNNRVVKERLKIMHDLNTELEYRFRQQFVGETAVILTEDEDGTISGRSERYFMVYLPQTAEKIKKNELVKVRLTENKRSGMFGKP